MVDKEKGIVTPLTPWRETTPGGVIRKTGNAKFYITGGWRSETPIWSSEKCKQCMLCFPVCPDSSICVKEGKMAGIDYDHCKGCGVCAAVCPFKAIHMVEGGEAK